MHKHSIRGCLFYIVPLLPAGCHSVAYQETTATLGHGLEQFVKNLPQPSQRPEEILNKRLMGTVKNNNHQSVAQHLKSGADPNYKDTQNNTPLHIAVQKGYTKVAQHLLDQKDINLFAKNDEEKTPLDIAQEQNRGGLVTKIVKSDKFKLSQTEDNGANLLTFAATTHSAPLWKAVTEKANKTAINQASKQIAQRIQTHINNADELAAQELIDFCTKQDFEGAESPLSERINQRNETLLHLALREGRSDIASELIAAAPNSAAAQDTGGKTPLHVAIQQTLKESAKELIEKAPASINKQDVTGKTPLHLAIENNQTEIATQMLQWQGINVNLADTNGYTPLHTAIKHGNLEIYSLILVVSSTGMQAKTKQGETVLHLAIQHWTHEDIGMADRLKRTGKPADQDIRERGPKNIAYDLIAQNEQSLKEWLLAQTTKNKSTPLHVLVQKAGNSRQNERLQLRTFTKKLKERAQKIFKKTAKGLFGFGPKQAKSSLWQRACAVKNKDGKTPVSLAKEHLGEDSEIYKLLKS